MAIPGMIAALTLMVAYQPAPSGPPTPAPPAGPNARYCMHVEMTGTRLEPVECWTRAEWADEGVDVDQDWAKEGVAVIA